MKSAFSLTALILFLAISAPSAVAGQMGQGKSGKEKNDSPVVNEKKDKGKPDKSKNTSNDNTHAAADVFAVRDRDTIRKHFVNYSGSLPPGLAKRGGDLPPGLEKQLQRNGHLPPGLEQKVHPFPVELERKLPPLRQGLFRGLIGGNAVIVNKKTSAILDVFVVQ
jgi:hypothetical protein